MSHDKGTAPHPWHWKPPVWGDAGTRPGTSNPSQPRVFSRVTGKRHQRLDSSSWTGNVELRFSLKTPAQAEPWVPQHWKGGGCSITTTLGTRVKGGLSDFFFEEQGPKATSEHSVPSQPVLGGLTFSPPPPVFCSPPTQRLETAALSLPAFLPAFPLAVGFTQHLPAGEGEQRPPPTPMGALGVLGLPGVSQVERF